MLNLFQKYQPWKVQKDRGSIAVAYAWKWIVKDYYAYFSNLDQYKNGLQNFRTQVKKLLKAICPIMTEQLLKGNEFVALAWLDALSHQTQAPVNNVDSLQDDSGIADTQTDNQPQPVMVNGSTSSNTETAALALLSLPAFLSPNKSTNGGIETASISNAISSAYYVEETAWELHNPKVEDIPVDKLLALLPPPPMPKLPQTCYCTWTFDEESRVLLADFSQLHGNTILYEDEKFLLMMMERDDITVISQGLVTGLDQTKWNLQYLSDYLGDKVHHRFRHFQYQQSNISQHMDDQGQQANVKQIQEVDGFIAMKFSDYVRYLEAHQEATLQLDPPKETRFEFQGFSGQMQSIDVCNDLLYMIDVDMVKLLPSLCQDFVDSFKLPEILPGGTHCMLHAVSHWRCWIQNLQT